MTLSKKTLALAFVGMVCAVAPSAADTTPDAGVPAEESAPTYVEVPIPFKMCVPDLSRCLSLDPGRYVAEPQWSMLDAETKRLQEQEIRLKAENKSFRETADSVPWPIIAISVTVGLMVGTYIGLKF